MDMNEIKDVFFQECEEQLAELETGLLAIHDGDTDPETVNAVFRAVHSIKGGAGAFALDDLVNFAHVFETTLDCLRSNRLEPTQSVVKVMLRSADVLADLTTAARDGGSVAAERCETLALELEALSRGEAAAATEVPSMPAKETIVPEPSLAGGAEFEPVPFSFDEFEDSADEKSTVRVFVVDFRPKPELYAKGNDAVLLMRDLSRLGTVETVCDASTLPGLAELDAEGAFLAWRIRLTTEEDENAIRSVFEFAEWDCELTISEAEPAASDGAVVSGSNPAQPAFEEGDNAGMVPVPVDLSAIDDLEGSGATPPAAGPEAAFGSPVPVKHAEAPHEGDDGASRSARPPQRASASTGSAAQPGQTIRVELERVDRLINLVGELVINQAMLAQSVNENGTGAGASAINIGLEELQRLTREIQDSVMAIRAQPVKPVFQRMSRIVREIADMTGKSVRLLTEGEATEVDKTVIDKLAEPLTHMIRNAVDHGLETPEERQASGKSQEGTLRLAAKHRSGRIVIEIADDGAGINRERVRKKAIDNGLITAETNLADEEIDNLIFHPGFSTAETISDISGRGVGMDVVKRSIQQLGGRISISSEPGKGSLFTMSLPLTLAVLDGMVVTVAGQTLVVPLTAIVETLKPEAGSVHRFGAGERLIAIRDSFSPLIDIGRALGFRARPAEPEEIVALLVETEGGGQRALMVDAIQGQRQVVIKSLEANYDQVPGIAAATILGDGRVALIVDVDAVVAGARSEPSRPEILLAAAE